MILWSESSSKSPPAALSYPSVVQCAIPAETGLERLRLFHAGMNLATDPLTLAWMLGLKGLVFAKRAACWFDAAARFTRKPMGISLRAEVEGRSGSATVDLRRHDLYQATAVVAVLATLGLGSGGAKPWLGSLWRQVDPDDFATLLEGAGFSLCAAIRSKSAQRSG